MRPGNNVITTVKKHFGI